MLLILHIISAISSLFYTAYVFISPSKSRINVAYGLVGVTLVTGFGLILTKPANMTQTCAEGLVYLFVAASGIIAARHKLIKQQI